MDLFQTLWTDQMLDLDRQISLQRYPAMAKDKRYLVVIRRQNS